MAALFEGSRAVTVCDISDEGLTACKPSVTKPDPVDPPSADCCKAVSGANFTCLFSYKNSYLLPYLGIDPDLAMAFAFQVQPQHSYAYLLIRHVKPPQKEEGPWIRRSWLWKQCLFSWRKYVLLSIVILCGVCEMTISFWFLSFIRPPCQVNSRFCAQAGIF
ncbi:hypothetical protein OIU77_024236 [Salix suchowensis]|uniref:Bifunctional inhibitor/plant lipid transfer protein/seed storage helical domain-containing protein n=1 Tax=Salix suchowensis TaxID=1278906 RepID=A0ABQ9BUX5_9ROSI|nr:hypothetical protein OIU77_024236 [Salix suchowensis]